LTDGEAVAFAGGEWMRILVIGDAHGDFGAVHRARRRFAPDLLLCCGDWGDPAEAGETDFAPLLAAVRLHTTYGNHDPLELLPRLQNRDGSAAWIRNGDCVELEGLRIGAIGGIWAKSRKKPYYVTDADVAEFAARIASRGPVDILLTHGCPIGLADLTPTGRHGGQRCFLEAFKTIAPRLHFCGHLHRAQERTLKSEARVVNVGSIHQGDAAVVEYDPRTRSLEARLVDASVAD